MDILRMSAKMGKRNVGIGKGLRLNRYFYASNINQRQ